MFKKIIYVLAGFSAGLLVVVSIVHATETVWQPIPVNSSSSPTLYLPAYPFASSTFSTNVQTQTLNEPIATSSATTNTTTIDWSQSSIASVQMNVATTTLSFTNCTNGQKPTLWVWQNATGSETVTWPSTGSCQIAWASSTAPTLTITANHGDAFSFQCFASFSTSTVICHGQYGSGNFSQ